MGREPKLILAAAAVAASLAAGGCGDDSSDQGQPAPVSPDVEQPLSPVERQGRDAFVEHCGGCHTLDAAGTTGSIGPNLDEVQANESDVLKAIEIGGRGSGQMPQNLVEGAEAQAVATFVANSGPGV